MPDDSTAVRMIVGTMTGTSMDGIDAALVRITGRGLGVQIELLAEQSVPYGVLGDDLRGISRGQPMDGVRFAELARQVGLAHCELVAEFDLKPDLVVLHGQTIVHQPPISWQLIDPHSTAATLGCPVMFDLRAPDLAAGGEGAPITPLADFVLFRHPSRRRAIVNLGGFCNVTILDPFPDDPTDLDDVSLLPIHGRDVCACNLVLDAVARSVLGQPFDDAGRAALLGNVDVTAKTDLLEHLREQGDAGRSLGTGDEAAGWVEQFIPTLAPGDLAATATAAISECIGMVLHDIDVDEVVLAGGGANHQGLIAGILSHVAAEVATSEAFGIPIQSREAIAIAVLGALAMDDLPITLPSVTGRADTVLARRHRPPCIGSNASTVSGKLLSTSSSKSALRSPGTRQ